MTTKPTCLAIALLAVSIPAAFGQKGKKEEKEVPPSLKARIVYVETVAENPADVYVAGPEGEFVKITPATGINAAAVSCPVTDGKIVLTKTESADEVVVTIPVPEEVKEGVIFLLKNPKTEEGSVPFLFQLVDDSYQTFPKGGSFICNFSPDKVRVTIAESATELDMGAGVIVSRPEKRDEFNMAAFQMEKREGEEWKPLRESMLRFADTERYYMIAFSDGKQPSLKIYKQPVNVVVTEPVKEKGKSKGKRK